MYRKTSIQIASGLFNKSTLSDKNDVQGSVYGTYQKLMNKIRL